MQEEGFAFIEVIYANARSIQLTVQNTVSLSQEITLQKLQRAKLLNCSSFKLVVETSQKVEL